MLFTFTFSYFLLCILLKANADIISSGASCETYVDKLDTCAGLISSAGPCYSAIANLTNTEYAQCTSNRFFWSYPLNNLTIIIETVFTQERRPYTIYLDNRQIMQAVTNIYRVFNNQEIDVTTRDDKLIQYSDSNYQVILKFQGPTVLSRYGVNINYNTTKTF